MHKLFLFFLDKMLFVQLALGNRSTTVFDVIRYYDHQRRLLESWFTLRPENPNKLSERLRLTIEEKE